MIRQRNISRGHSAYALFSPTKRREFFYQSRSHIIPQDHFAEEIARLRRLMVTLAPDVVFLNGFSVFVWMLFAAASAEGIPTVMQHAGIFSKEVLMYADRFSSSARRAFLAMERQTILSATEHIFLNKTSQAAFIASVGTVSPQHTHIIPLPYETALIDTAPAGQRRTGAALRIGCVARWDRIKNHQALLRLAKTAHDMKLPWLFETVTSIPHTTYRMQMKRSYQRYITVHPPMKRAALKQFYQSMDLMVLPSHFDVSPTVVLEAALAGIPTLITPEVGWADTYRNHKLDTYIMDFSDSVAVVQRIQALQKKRAPLSFQRFLLKNHAPERVFGAYVRLFRSIC